KGCRKRAAAAKARIQAPIRVITRHGHARRTSPPDAGAHRDDLAVGLDHHSSGEGGPAEIGEDLSAAAERRVEAAVWLVACQGELCAARAVRRTRGHDLAITLEGRRLGHAVEGAREHGTDFTLGTKAEIERARIEQAAVFQILQVRTDRPRYAPR